MPRTQVVMWNYECDAASWGPDGTFSCDELLEVSRGDCVSTGSRVWFTDVVRNQADANAFARQRGWSIGAAVLCPAHSGKREPR